MIYGHSRFEKSVYAVQGIFGDICHCTDYHADTKFRSIEYLLFRKLFLSSFEHCHDFCHKDNLYSVLDMGIELDLSCRCNHVCMVLGSYPVCIDVYFDCRSHGRLLMIYLYDIYVPTHQPTNKIDLKI